MAKQESDLKITEEELERFQEAMKNDEFRKMFSEYAKEISDPENRKRYEEEIAQLEAERGMDVKFINPQDGFVLKTSVKSEGGMKAFINICQSDVIGKATSKDSSKKVDEKNVKGQEWSIPYSLNQPREDLDKAGKKCTVYDVVFHTKTYQMGEEDPRFKQLVINTTLDAIERNWNVKLDRKNLKYPKLKFKGTKTSSIVRTSNDKGVKSSGADILIGDKTLPYPYKDKTPDIKDEVHGTPNNDEKSSSSDSHSFTPKYSIVHRGHLDLQNFTNARDSRASTRPQELVVNIELPLCETSSGVDLDIFEKQLILDSPNPKYHLDITLPYPVNEDQGRAQFDKSKRRLIITLPVLPAPPVVVNGYAGGDLLNGDADGGLLNADSVLAGEKKNGLVTEILENNIDCQLPQFVNGDDGEDGCIDEKDESELNSSEEECAGANVRNLAGITSCQVLKTPPFSFHQNDESVTFVLHIPRVSLDTVSLGFHGNKCSISFPSTSIPSTNFLSPGYALYIKFPDECLIDSERSSVDINERNVVLVLYKQENCVGMWQHFMTGSDEDTLEKKLFLTEDTLQESLDQVEDHWPRQPISIDHRVVIADEEETLIQFDIKRENSADSDNMGNILASAEDLLIREAKSGTGMDNVVQTTDNVKSGATRKGTDVVEPTDDTVMVNDDELDEVEVIEENFDDDNIEADGQNDPQRLSTVQEIDATNAAKNDTATGNAEMQRARAIKCRKNRRRRRRSTGSHESSSVSEEEGDGTGRRGKQRGKHARRQRMSRSLSFGSSADSHDDFDLVNGHRCVRFNPVPEVRLFSNRADKRKWKEVRKQQLLTGNTEPENTVQERTCKLKSSLKDTSRTDKERLSISSDDGLETAVTDIITDNGDDNHNNDYVDSKANDVITDDGDNHDDDDDDDDDVDDDDDDDVDDEEENGDSFVKVEKPELTNPLIFDLDD